MRRIDELHLDYPFAGSRMLRDLLRGEGVMIGRELVATLVRRIGLEAIYRKPNTSKAALGHKIYHICCAGWRSSGQIRCGRWISPTFRWPAGSSIWRRWSTGSAGGFCRGGFRSQWTLISASMRWRRLSPVTAGRKFSTSIREHLRPVRSRIDSIGYLLFQYRTGTFLLKVQSVSAFFRILSSKGPASMCRGTRPDRAAF